MKEFLQWLVSKGELNFFLADSTARALTRAGCKTVSDLQSLDDAKWASLRLALDTTQKVRKHLDQRAQVKIVEVHFLSTFRTELVLMSEFRLPLTLL